MKDLVSENPFTLKIIKTYPQTTQSGVDQALSLSFESYLSWCEKDIDHRISKFQNLAKVITEQKEELAKLATDEMGKPFAQALAEVEKCAQTCNFYAENAQEFLKNKNINTDSNSSFVTYQPLGVILGVMPWNFPYWQAFRFAIPTIMAGNTVLLKHASNVSGCSLKIQKLFEDAGFNKGIFQSLLMSSDRVESLISNPKIKGVSLTGSTSAGKKVAAIAATHLKRQVLELGGSDPYIVLADADIKKAAEICMKSRLQNNGQSCIAAKRFIVVKEVYEEFKNQIIKIAQSKKLGDPHLSSSDLGPLARKDLKDELHEQVNSAIAGGAKISYQGSEYDKNDAFYPITIIENMKPDNKAYYDEFFGPVVLLYSADSTDEAVKIANDSPFGLGAAIFSKNEKLATEIATFQIQSGNCFVNSMVKSNPKLPFGGINDSGYGRELSLNGMHEFVNIKSVSID